MSRYNPRSLSSPIRPLAGKSGPRRDGNRSIQFRCDEPRAVIVLTHGLTDSPHHVLAVARAFQNAGVHAYVMRFPGHGTVPAGIAQVNWEDWDAALKFGVRMARKNFKDLPLYIGGFSTGGALVTHYALEAQQEEGLRKPDKVYLFSPALGITKLAKVSGLHRILSWLAYFEKFRWLDIRPEYDPFKYNSFPKDASVEIYQLVEATQERIERAHSDGYRIPTVHTFHSVVDDTVSSAAVKDFHVKVTGAGSELVLFDINHHLAITQFAAAGENAADQVFLSTALEDIRTLLEPNSPTYRHTVVSNRSTKDGSLLESSTSAREEPTSKALNLTWPKEVYSLSHSAIPIAPNDVAYGQDSILTTMNPRGERNLLSVPPADLVRLRYNPFFSYVEEKIAASLDSN